MIKPVISGLLLAASLLAISAVGTANSADELKAYYTDAQADRGQRLYTARCEACHGDSMPRFFVNYSSAERFYLYISGSMPHDAPGTLSDEQNADLVAYTLRQTGWPAGDEELPPDRSVLREIIPADAVPAPEPVP